MTHTIYAINTTDPDKLAHVIREMRSLGAPTIEVVDCGDYYMALEGSHRLAAAHKLGIAPKLVIHEQDEILDISRYDWYAGACWAADGRTDYSAGEVAGELYGVRCVPHAFDEFI